MAERYQRPVARLRHISTDSVVGSGFLAPRNVVVTCAHVVNAALGRGLLDELRPEQAVPLDLPWAGNISFRGTVIDWRPPVDPSRRSGNRCVDIAVLALDRAAPIDNAVQPQSLTPIDEDTKFRVMGFPFGADSGASARGSIRSTDADGWHEVLADKSYGRTMELGFSGAPAIEDGGGNRLLGMLAISCDEDRRATLIPLAALMRASPSLAEPYQGLAPFREQDAEYFFGRESFVQHLWDRFERHTVTLLAGPSASGKSSLINAGFLPRLRAGGAWTFMRMHPGERPIRSLARELTAALKPDLDPLDLESRSYEISEALLKDPTRLLAYGETCRRVTGRGLCLVVDQLEETFTLAKPANPAQHRALMGTLAALAESREPVDVKAVLGLRSDFQTLLQSDEDAAALVDAVNGAPPLLLRPMVPAEREHVILGPLSRDRLDVALEDGLLDQIMGDIAHNADALPLLEFALAELWQHLTIDEQGRRLTCDSYQKIGGEKTEGKKTAGIFGILAHRADAVLRELGDELDRVRRLFIELVRVADTPDQDTRRPRTKAELDALDPGLWPIAERLAQHRMTVMTEGPGVDIIHEALFRQWETLRQWISEERDFLRWRQRLDERRRDWIGAERDPQQFLRGRILDEASGWLQSCGPILSEDQRQFIRDSHEAEHVAIVRDQANRLWNGLEFSWNTDIENLEYQALLDVQRADPSVRRAFLLSVMDDESRARRFCRKSHVALRASLGLDAEHAATLAHMVSSRLAEQTSPSAARAGAALCIAAELSHFLPNLAAQALEVAPTAIAKTTSVDELGTYVTAIWALAARVDPATAGRVVNSLVSAVALTSHYRQLGAYTAIITDLAQKLGSSAARHIFNKVVRAVSETIDGNLLETYAGIIKSLAGHVDRASARQVINDVINTISMTTNPHALAAYLKIVAALARYFDTLMANQLVADVVDAITRTSDTRLLKVYTEVIEAIADHIDAATAFQVVGDAITLITRTKNHDERKTYAATITALADHVDPLIAIEFVGQMAKAITAKIDDNDLETSIATINVLAMHVDAVMANEIVDKVVAAIARPMDRSRGTLKCCAATIVTLLHHLDGATVHSAAITIVIASNRTTDRDALEAYATIIEALADRLDGAMTQRLIEIIFDQIARTTNFEQLKAYTTIIRELNRHLDGTIAHKTIDEMVTVIAKTTNAQQMKAYSIAIRALTNHLDSANACQVVRKITTNIDTIADDDQLHTYATIIEAMARHVDAATAHRAVDKLVTGIGTTWHRDALEAYPVTIAALVKQIDVTTARWIIDKVVAAVVGNVAPNQLRAYAATITALAEHVDTEVARAAVLQVLKRMSELQHVPREGKHNEFTLFELVAVLIAVGHALRFPEWLLAATEMLKHPLLPLSRRGERRIPFQNHGEELRSAITEHCGRPEDAPLDLWELVEWLSVCEPWLPLGEPLRTTEKLRIDLDRLAEHEPTLPGASDIQPPETAPYIQSP
jgi:hypothetical protein